MAAIQAAPRGTRRRSTPAARRGRVAASPRCRRSPLLELAAIATGHRALLVLQPAVAHTPPPQCLRQPAASLGFERRPSRRWTAVGPRPRPPPRSRPAPAPRAAPLGTPVVGVAAPSMDGSMAAMLPRAHRALVLERRHEREALPPLRRRLAVPAFAAAALVAARRPCATLEATRSAMLRLLLRHRLRSRLDHLDRCCCCCADGGCSLAHRHHHRRRREGSQRPHALAIQSRTPVWLDTHSARQPHRASVTGQ